MFEIGQKVSWLVRDTKMKGCVLQQKEDKVEVISHFRGTVPHVQKMIVEKSILTKV